MVAGGVAAGYAVLNQRSPEPAPTPELLETASPSLSPSPETTVSTTGDEQQTELEAVGGYEGEGEATRSVEGGRFKASLSVKLPDPPPGKFYQAWLERKTPLATFPIGRLVKDGEDWRVEIDQTRDATAYSNVIVSLESTDDSQRETSVLEGSF